MNVTALLDTPVRSPTPLDSSVGDGGTDPAFANVMSQYQGNGNKSLAPGVKSESAKASSDTSTDAVECAAAGADPNADEDATLVTAGLVDASGEPLPPPVGVDGQPLPLLGDAVSQLPGLRADSDDTPDATDASAAAAMLLGAPLPAPAAATTAAIALPTPVATTPASDSTADVPAPPPVQPEPLPAAADPTAADADPAIPLPPLDPRTIKKDGDAAAIAQTTAPAPTDDSALRSGSVVHALRALGLGHRQNAPDGNAPQNPDAGRARDANGSSAGQLGDDGASKIANAHLASVVEAAAQKDPAAPPKEGAADTIRTDAISPRANGPVDAARDTAATRLSDLAQQHAPRFAAELADRVLVLRSQRFDSASVSLEPRDLGRIDIQVRLQADTTHVAFTAQHASVRDALEGQMPRLRALLEEAGLSLGNVDVAHSGNRGAGDSGTARSYAGPQAPTATDLDVADASPRWQRRTETSLIDLHA